MSDILAGLDAAVADGVGIISMSLGSGYPPPEFHRDNIAIGTFGAISKGVLVSTSAGNSGPKESTVNNVAPWMLTVGASTINREFPADVVLGSGNTLTGSSLYAGEPLSSTQLPLVSGEDAGSTYCEPGWLFKDKIAGKIVVCRRKMDSNQYKSGVAVSESAGAGAIFINPMDRVLVQTEEDSANPCTCDANSALASHVDEQPTRQPRHMHLGVVEATLGEAHIHVH